MAEDIDIRPLAEGDIDGAIALSSSCGWNQRAAEWHVLRQIAPSGAFAAATSNGIVGTAIGIDYGSFGWIAMMLVDPAHRGRGLGARLLEAAMGAIPAELPLRLDATPLGRPLYERYGFRLETPLTRHVRGAGTPAPPPAREEVTPLAESDLPAVMAMDDRLCGGHRHAAVRWAFADGRQYAWIGGSHPAGPQYCLGRGGRLFDHVGPIVAGDADVAIALATAAIGVSRAQRSQRPGAEDPGPTGPQQAAGRAIAIDAFDAHERFTAWLQTAGFEPQRPLYRMQRPGAGGRTMTQATPGLTEFAIMGPEFS